MKLNPSVFKAYDIRGVYQKDIDAESFEPVARAIVEFFKADLNTAHPTILLSRDMRIGSPPLYETAKKVLVASGATVIDAGLLPTPTFYYGVLKYQYDAGIHITASHNPAEYVGTKFVKRNGQKIIKIGKATGMDRIREMAMANTFPAYTNDGNVVVKEGILADEVADAMAEVDATKIKAFTIAADPANGMGGLYITELMKHIPGTLTMINEKLDGNFPAHQADPLDFNNLIPLQEKVKEIKADVGFEPDGDGDRIFFIDERAQVVPATHISSLIASEVLKTHKGAKIIVDIRYTRNVTNVVEKNGGSVSISKVGHAFITEQVNNEGAFYAGESSGHFYFGQTGGAESAVKVILYVLLAMSETGKPLSAILKDLETSSESGEINFVLPDGSNTKALMEEIAEEHKEGTASWLDGVSVDFPDWRFNIRSSNTEPLLRLNVEAQTPELMKEKFQLMIDRITSSGAKIKEAGH
ncbi:phosphomannomutase/phosphoglucomutase [Candidatus Microgenomates bacterium]|nr:phosphomannomutase/phosphoglucomutase [Candidatus Microgenomates bacterium]